jgi:hypothetical protein
MTEKQILPKESTSKKKWWNFIRIKKEKNN